MYTEPARPEVLSLRSALAKAHADHQADIETIGQMALDFATTHGWCSTYDKFVDTVNNDLNIKLPTRENRYVITVNVEIEANCTHEDIEHVADQIALDISNSDVSIGRIFDVTVDDWGIYD